MTPAEQLLSPQLAAQLWRYDPDAGALYWRASPCNPIPAGSPAGNLDNEGYVRVKYQKNRYMVHRIAWVLMTGAWPEVDGVDHENTDPSDNRWINLRACTAPKNRANRRRGRGTYLRGVHPHRNRWVAKIAGDYLGMFPSEQAAHEAYRVAAIERYGEFARFD